MHTSNYKANTSAIPQHQPHQHQHRSKQTHKDTQHNNGKQTTLVAITETNTNTTQTRILYKHQPQVRPITQIKSYKSNKLGKQTTKQSQSENELNHTQPTSKQSNNYPQPAIIKTQHHKTNTNKTETQGANNKQKQTKRHPNDQSNKTTTNVNIKHNQQCKSKNKKQINPKYIPLKLQSKNPNKHPSTN